MRAEDFGDVVLGENARVDHGARARAAFFVGLEDEQHAAGEVAVGGQGEAGGRQPRRVAVMAAGVREPFRPALPIGRAAVRHREAVDVGAKRHGLPRAVPFDQADETALDDLGVGREAGGLELRADEPDRAGRLKAELGMLMDVAAEGDQHFGDRGERGIELVGMRERGHGCVS